MKKNIFTLYLVLTCGLLSAQVGKIFPDMPVTTLLGHHKNFSIPAKTKGKVALIAVGYTEEAFDKMDGWYDPVFRWYVQDASHKTTFKSKPIAQGQEVYFVAMLTGLKQAVKGKVEKKMQELDKDLKPYFAIYAGSNADFKELGIGDSKAARQEPYFFLLDQSGKVVYVSKGKYSQAEEQKLYSKLEEMLGDPTFED